MVSALRCFIIADQITIKTFIQHNFLQARMNLCHFILQPNSRQNEAENSTTSLNAKFTGFYKSSFHS